MGYYIDFGTLISLLTALVMRPAKSPKLLRASKYQASAVGSKVGK